MLSPSFFSSRLPRARGAGRAAGAAGAGTKPRSRLVVTLVVAALATTGPVLESALGEGRGWTLGFLILLIAPSLARAGGPRFHPLDPETYVPASYFLSVGYAPVLGLVMSSSFALSSRDTAAMQIAYAGAAACALVCTAMSRVPEPPNTALLVPSDRPRAMLDQDWGAIAVGVVGLGLVAALLASIGVGRVFSIGYSDMHLAEDGKGMLGAGWYLVRIAIVYCFLRLASLRKAGLPAPRVLIVAGACLLVSILFNTVIGRRGPLVWTALSIGLALHAYGIQIRRLWLALGMVCALFYGIAIQGARAQQGEGFEAQISSAMAHLEQTENVLDIGEFRRIYENLVVVANEKPSLVHYPGESWVNGFLILVPKPIWPDRPLGLGQRYVMWIAPDFARHGGGFAMSATAEGYLNFGYLGTFIEVAVFSALFFFHPLNVAAARDATMLIRATAACLASFAYNQFRGELTSLLKITVSLGIALIAALVLASLSRHVRRGLASLASVRRGGAGGSLRDPRLGRRSAPGG
ncbi:hypothetical protein SOCEGT47_065300 [Sorangium cellulosum]|uniref:Oligosaccharide repeat unit polymerase n=1 Tax=Sorangium cellulosum TaxID=56 RepID=A0A4P2Q8Q4_SORCE|nr:oligosaccharide repeat unit polymerase [Sorangium cellulosum]AUX25977.1 hypothetical protein SOCEGT47_065300 [Sorangium cellulosum]